jgi:L-malate glycosyltransferase
MRVLYASHTSALGGGERSLLALIDALPPEVEPLAASPPGALAEELRSRGVSTHRIRGTNLSLRPHPLRTPHGLATLAASAAGLRRLARTTGADLVHANSVRAGLAACGARRLGGPPTIVHVRDCLPHGLLAYMTRRAVGSGAALVLANSRYTARSFEAERFGLSSRVIYNGVDANRFDPDSIDRGAARDSLALSPNSVAIGVVAQITPWKGQDVAIEALARVRQRHPQAELVLAGEATFSGPATRYDNIAFERRLRDAAKGQGVNGGVRFLGRREDVPAVMAALDILLVPSWEEPFGNTILEGMAMGLPVLATTIGGSAELITDGSDGLLVAPHDPGPWAQTIGALIEDPERRGALGAAARQRASEFTLGATARAAVEAYRAVLAESGSAKA